MQYASPVGTKIVAQGKRRGAKPQAPPLLALLVGSFGRVTNAADDDGAVWDHFAMLVWQYKTPPPGPDAKKAYETVHLRGIHLDNGFSDRLLDFARRNRYEFYVDHTAGKGDLDGKNIAEVNGQRYTKPLGEKLMYDGALRYKDFVLYERALSATTGGAEGRVAGSDVIVKKKTGRGTAVYLNLSPVEYLLKRRGPGGNPYRELVSSLLADADAAPRATIAVDGVVSPTVERLFWRKGPKAYLCVVANAMRDAKMDAAGTVAGVSDAGPATLRLSFRTAVSGFRNERTGAEFGEGAEFDDRWLPCEANVYSFDLPWDALDEAPPPVEGASAVIQGG